METEHDRRVAYWEKNRREAAIALGVATTRLAELGVGPRDKNGKYINKNDVVKREGESYTFVEIVEPWMFAVVKDSAGVEHYFDPKTLEKEEYV